MESIPSRVFTSCRPADPLGPAPTPTRFFAPSTASPGLAPCAAARPSSAAVPLSGFPNLSAVSWQARASRPCLMPQPPVGFSLRSLAPRRGRVRLSASLCSLAVLHRTSTPRARAWPFHSGFHRRPRLATRWPGSPPELGHRFHRACAYAPIGFPGALTLPAHLGQRRSGFGCFEALIPPRSRTAGAAEATFHGPCSPGLRPSRAFLRSSLGAS